MESSKRCVKLLSLIFILTYWLHNKKATQFVTATFSLCFKQGIKNRNSVLNRVRKSAIFVLNRVRVWGARSHLPTQGHIEKPPPPDHKPVYLSAFLLPFPCFIFQRLWKPYLMIFKVTPHPIFRDKTFSQRRRKSEICDASASLDWRTALEGSGPIPSSNLYSTKMN